MKESEGACAPSGPQKWYLKAESENQIGATPVLKIYLDLHEHVKKIIA